MPDQCGSATISAEHCVIASTNTRSKKSSSGITRSTSPRSVAVRCGPRRWPGSSTRPIVPCRARTANGLRQRGALPQAVATWSSLALVEQRADLAPALRVGLERADVARRLLQQPRRLLELRGQRAGRRGRRRAAATATTARGRGGLRRSGLRARTALHLAGLARDAVVARLHRAGALAGLLGDPLECRLATHAAAHQLDRTLVRALGGTCIAGRRLTPCGHIASLPELGCGQSSRQTTGEPPPVSRVAEPAVTVCQVLASTPLRPVLCSFRRACPQAPTAPARDTS